ncbi:MAG: PD40 domain-containing protein [Phycisphaerae bacterium]|nr:PD40 domain-containing protein [Phycisphaerae bacterium]
MVGKCLAVLACGLLLFGCTPSSAFRVRIATDPETSIVAVEKSDGSTVQKERAAPAEVTLSFADSLAKYQVKANPTGGATENYKATVRTLTRADVEKLPGSGSTKELVLRLDEKPYIEMADYQATYDPKRGGWVAVKSRKRSYTLETEDNALLPDRVYAFKGWDGIRGAGISPDGSRIAFAGFKAKPPPTPDPKEAKQRKKDEPPPDPLETSVTPVASSEVRAVVLRSGAEQPISDPKRLTFDPSFSPDGEYVVYVGMYSRPGFTDIFRQFATRQGGRSTITTYARSEAALKPSEAMGEVLVFGLMLEDASVQDDASVIARKGLAGYDTNLGQGTQPAISPDGKRFAYISKGDLYVRDIDGSGILRLTFDADEITRRYREKLTNPMDQQRFEMYERDHLFSAYSHPTWTPDGRFVVFSSMRNADPEGRPNEDIFAIPTNGSGTLIALTTNPSADRLPMIAKDGLSVYFVSNRGKQWGLWRIDAPAEIRPASN